MIENFTFQEDAVYYRGELVKKLSAASFEFLYHNDYKCIIKNVKGIWWFYAFSKKPSLKFLTKDAEHFSIINDDFAKDSTQVYLIAKKGMPIPHSDPATFVVLEQTPYFSKDKHHLYGLSTASGLFIYKDVDSASLVPLDWGGYITDKHNIYHFSPPITLHNRSKYNTAFGHPVTNKDRPFDNNRTLLLEKYPDLVGWWHPDYAFHMPLPPLDVRGYYQTDHAVYYIFDIDGEDPSYIKPDYTVMDKVDLPSFEILSEHYAKDQNHIYFQHRIVEGVDVASFRVIRNKLAEDAHTIFFNGYSAACDKGSFELLQETPRNHAFEVVARDKTHLYVDAWTKFGKLGMRTGYDKTLAVSKKIADPSSFELLNDQWAKDNQHIYYGFKPHEQVDRASFQRLFEGKYNDWAKDDQYLYQNGEVVKGIDGGTFQVLSEHWGKDANCVFSFITGRIRSTIDAATFQVRDDQGGGEDKDFVYYFDNWGELKKKKKK